MIDDMDKSNLKPGKLAEMAQERGLSTSELVRLALKEGGSKMGAARYLGVNPNTIRYHIQRLGITVTTQFQVDVVEQPPVIVEN
mgnify:CR=1 FL=1